MRIRSPATPRSPSGLAAATRHVGLELLDQRARTLRFQDDRLGRGAELLALLACEILERPDDHGSAAPGGTAPEALQEFEAVHPRHEQVEHDRGRQLFLDGLD